jgi:hypothetical protein
MDVRSAVIKQATVSAVLLDVMMVFYASAGHTDIPHSGLLLALALAN